jgi:hypothetical protein
VGWFHPRWVAGLSLAGALAFALWLGLGRDGGWSDGLRVVSDPALQRRATWGDARPAPWGNADGATRAALSPDGRWIVWALPSEGNEASQDLFLAAIEQGHAGPGLRIDGLCSDFDDSAPAFGPGHVYFSSDRPGGQGGHDLWRASFADGSFGTPEPVPGPANTAGDERDPAPALREARLVFSSDRDGAGWDLHEAPLGPGESRRIEELCTRGDEREALFTAEDRALVFARDGGDGFDLFRAARFEGRFQGALALGALNTADDERAPCLDPDPLALCFARRRDAEPGALLRAPAVELFLGPRTPIGWMEWLALAGLLLLALLALLTRRFPELENFTKCLLVSVVLHLLLVWWFHAVWLNLGDGRREEQRAPMQVRLERPSPAVVPPEVEAAETAEILVQREEVARSEPALPEVATPQDSPREVLRRAEWAPTESEARPTPSAELVPELSSAAEVVRAEPHAQRLPSDAPPGESLAALEPRPEPRAAPTAATRPPALDLSKLAELAELAAVVPTGVSARTPERLESAGTAARPLPPRASVEAAAPEHTSRVRPPEPTLAPTVSASSARAPRESTSSGETAAPAPHLDLESLADAAAAPTSRSIGTPSRAALDTPRGSPAASRDTGALARRGSPEVADPAAQARAAREELEMSMASGVSGRAAPESLRGAARSDGARAAGSAPELVLGEAGGAGTAPGRGRDSSSSGPERAATTRAPLHQALLGGSEALSPARRASEGAPAGLASRAAPETPSGSRSSSLRSTELQDDGPNAAPREADVAPQLALGEWAPEEGRSGPRGANSAAPARAEIERAARGSAAPSPALDRQGLPGPWASAEDAPIQAPDRSRAPLHPGTTPGPRSLQDVPLEVARAAGGVPPAGEARWLPEVPAATPGGGPAAGQGIQGPTRAASPAAASALATPRASGPELARAPAAEIADEARPGKSPWEATPYRNRNGAEKARALEQYGGSEETEAAVARGLAYLAKIQSRSGPSSGSWGDVSVVDPKYGRVAVGKTALCVLAFLGAGHTPQSNTEHSAVVTRALGFLLSTQDEESGHFGDASAYDHGISTYAVAECFALTRDGSLRPALEKALAHVLAMQSRRNDPRFQGGWGYYFADGSHYDPWPRTSITAWQVMALESARLSGLQVPDGSFDAARAFLEQAFDPQLSAYRYNHEPERLSSVYATLPASTPAALFALALLGEDVTSARHRVSRDYVLERAPDGYRFTGELDFVRRARGNPYFWYYGTLAMFRVGGEEWRRWNVALQECLLPAQGSDGAWDPLDPYARYARDHGGDKSYTTALCVLSLEVYYRYYLPLLKVR